MKFVLSLVLFSLFVVFSHADLVRDMRSDSDDDADFMNWYQPMEPWKNEGSAKSGTKSNEAQKPTQVPQNIENEIPKPAGDKPPEPVKDDVPTPHGPPKGTTEVEEAPSRPSLEIKPEHSPPEHEHSEHEKKPHHDKPDESGPLPPPSPADEAM